VITTGADPAGALFVLIPAPGDPPVPPMDCFDQYGSSVPRHRRHDAAVRRCRRELASGTSWSVGLESSLPRINEGF
jgi:hypothetical protein